MRVSPLEIKIEVSYSEATNVNISVESVSEDSIESSEAEDKAVFEMLYESETATDISNKGSESYLKFRKLCP